MAQLVALPGRAPVHLINEDLAGLDGFSLKSAFKGLKKLARKGLDPLGKALLKGREYVVEDGDILAIRFSV